MQFMHISSGAKIRDRHALDRRLWQKKETNRGVYSLGKALDLIECRLLIATFPTIKLWEHGREIFLCPAGAARVPIATFPDY